MFSRILRHGQEGCVLNASMEAGLPVPLRGGALLEIEFLTRFTRGGPGCCFYTVKPPHIALMASLFPTLQFFVFDTEYDPDRADIKELLVTERNVTTSNCPFNKYTARLLGNRDPRELLFMISTTESPTVKLLYHALARPDFSLFRIDDIPVDYLQGEFMYPLYTRPNSSTVYLMAEKSAKATVYEPSLLTQEIAYFHISTKNSGRYDIDAENLIVNMYIGLGASGCSYEQLKDTLEML
jgi:hypothetical protein